MSKFREQLQSSQPLPAIKGNGYMCVNIWRTGGNSPNLDGFDKLLSRNAS